MKNIYCIVGRSGSGKTTVAEALEKRYGYKTIESYTTRERRYDGETGHIFVTPEEFRQLKDVCAYTWYNGHEYGATAEQVDTHDLYVIDIAGVRYFREHYHGEKGVVVLGLFADEEVVRERMRKRGDAPKKIRSRIATDKVKFADLNSVADIVLNASKDDADGLVERVKSIIAIYEA